MAYKATICALLLALVVSTSAAAGELIEGQVVGVTDGDTIKVLTPQKALLKIRLYGVDTPEKRQDYGSRAKQATSALVYDQSVVVDVIDRDRYGRLVALVMLPDGRNLNLELVRGGWAWVYPQYCRLSFCADWKRAEAEARSAGAGLWAAPDPLPPWLFRRQRR